ADAHADGQVEPGAFLTKLGRRKVHRQPALARKRQPAVPDGGPDALLRFSDRPRCESHQRERDGTAGDVDLDFHHPPLETAEKAAEDPGDHAWQRRSAWAACQQRLLRPRRPFGNGRQAALGTAPRYGPRSSSRTESFSSGSGV